MNGIGERIKHIRKNKKDSQAVLADKIHVDQTSISQYETEGTNIPLDKCIDIANTYGVSLDWLCGTEGVPIDNPKSIIATLKKYIKYVERAKEYGEEDRSKDDPPVSLRIHPAFHKFLIKNVIADQTRQESEKGYSEIADKALDDFSESIKQGISEDDFVKYPLVREEDIF